MILFLRWVGLGSTPVLLPAKATQDNYWLVTTGAKDTLLEHTIVSSFHFGIIEESGQGLPWQVESGKDAKTCTVAETNLDLNGQFYDLPLVIR
jgi:hypothetical protein